MPPQRLARKLAARRTVCRVNAIEGAMDDDELIVRMAAGDDTALRELFSRHAPWLAARLRLVLPAADVEDVLQETFLAVWRGARRLPARGRGRLAVGHCPAAGRHVLRRRGPAAAGAARRGRGRRAGSSDPAEAACPGPSSRRPSRAGAARQPAAGGLATDVHRGPAGGRGCGADGRPRGHGQEPRAPGPTAAAGGRSATALRHEGGMTVMSVDGGER